MSPRETNEEMPTPSRDRCSSRTTPTPPDCSARRRFPAWDGGPRASRPGTCWCWRHRSCRPDQPHAVAAADPQQLHASRAVQARRDHHQGPDPPPPALLGDTGHGRRRRGDDRQVDFPGQRGGRRHARDPVQLGHARVNRVDRPREVAGGDVLQDGPPDGAGVSARADDRDRGWGQHVPQARHAGGPFPFGDRVTVGAEGGVGLAGRQRKRQVVHAVRQGALRPQPSVGEHLHHERVLGQGLRGKTWRLWLRASEIRCSSNSVPTPRLCMSSATAIATSADREPSPATS